MNKGLKRMAWLAAVAWSVCLAFAAVAAEPATEPADPVGPEASPGAEERMGQAYLMITRAAQVHAAGDPDLARETYEDALGLLESIETDYPGWFTRVVRQRILYCESVIEQIRTGKTPEPLLAEKMPAPPMAPAIGSGLDFPLPPDVEATSLRALIGGIAERDARVEELRAEIRELKERNRRLTEELEGSRAGGDAFSVYPAVLKAEARRLIESGANSNAVALLTETHRLLPQDETVAHLLAVALCRDGDYEAAIRLAQPLAKRQGRRSGDIWLTLGVAQLGLGNLGRSRAAFENALDRDPTLTEAHFNLAQILIRLEKPNIERARQHYERAVQSGAARDPNLELAIRQALLVERVKRLK